MDIYLEKKSFQRNNKKNISLFNFYNNIYILFIQFKKKKASK